MDATALALWALFLIDLLGFGGVMYWMNRQIGALKGTVQAQATVLSALTGLNQAALEVVKGVDPERWAAEVRIHKELADKKAHALVEEERRRLDQEKKTAQEKSAELLRLIADQYSAALELALGLIAYIPKETRPRAIERLDVPDDLKKLYLQVAEKSPDWSAPLPFGGLPGLAANVSSLSLAEIARQVMEMERREKRTGDQ